MNRDQKEAGATVSKEMEFLQQFEAVPLVELPIAMETKLGWVLSDPAPEAESTCSLLTTRTESGHSGGLEAG